MSSWAFAPPPTALQRMQLERERGRLLRHFRRQDQEQIANVQEMPQRPGGSRGRDNLYWDPEHRGPQPPNSIVVPSPQYRAALTTYLHTTARDVARMAVWAERTFSQWPDDLKARWPRVRDELLSAVDRVQNAMRTFLGQVSLRALEEVERMDEREDALRPLRTNVYDQNVAFGPTGTMPLREWVDRIMGGVSVVDRAYVEGLLSTCASLTELLINDANTLQFGAMDARDLAAMGEPVRSNVVVGFDWMPAYSVFITAKDVLRAVGTVPRRALPYVRPRLPYNRKPRQRDDVFDSDEELMATPAPTPYAQPIVQAPIAEQAAMEARIRRNLREGAPLVDWEEQPVAFGPAVTVGSAAVAGSPGKKRTIYGSSAGDFDPTAWLQRRVKIPRVPKVEGGALADFDPTAWLQRRVKIPRQSPKAAQ